MLKYNYSIDFIYLEIPEYNYTFKEKVKHEFTGEIPSRLDFSDKFIYKDLWGILYRDLMSVDKLDDILYQMYFDDLIYHIPDDYCIETKLSEKYYDKLSNNELFKDSKDFIFNADKDTFTSTNTTYRIFTKLYKDYLMKIRDYCNRHNWSTYYDSNVWLPSQILYLGKDSITVKYSDNIYNDHFDYIIVHQGTDNDVDNLVDLIKRHDFNYTSNQNVYDYTILKINFNIISV